MKLRLLLIFLLTITSFILGCEDPKDDDNTPPSVQLTLPANLSSVSELVKIKAQASDNDKVDRVIFFIDGIQIDSSSDNSEPYEYNWLTVKLINGSSHTISAKAFDKSGNIGLSQVVSVTVDNTSSLPGKVGLKYSILECTTFKISWIPSSDADFHSYTVYKSNASDMSNPEILLNSENLNDTTINATNISIGETKYFRMDITDIFGLTTKGDVIAFSNNNPVPTMVTLKSRVFECTSFKLSWTPNSDPDFQSYTIYKSSSQDMSGQEIVYTSTNKQDSVITVSDIPINEARYYRMSVKDLCGQTALGEIKSINNLNVPPAKINFSEATLANGTISFKWTASTDCDFKNYRIKESENADMSNSTVIYETNNVGETSYSLLNFPAETEKYYSLEVTDNYDISTESSIISINSFTVDELLTHTSNTESYFLKSDGTGIKKLLNYGFPIWMNNKNSIAVQSGSQIKIFGRQNLNIEKTINLNPSYSGFYLAYSNILDKFMSIGSSNGNQTIIITDNSGNAIQIAKNYSIGSPAASAVDDWIYFVSADAGVNNIHRMKSDGTNEQTITFETTYTFGSFGVSYDGKFIVAPKNNGSKYYLSVINTETKNEVKIDVTSVGEGIIGYATFSRNGEYIYFTATSSRNLYKIKKDGTGLKQLTFSNITFHRAIAW